MAGITSSELVNYVNVAREVGVSAKVVRGYFEILDDTLLGQRLPSWTRSSNRRMIQTAKFYLFDGGLANHLARRRPVIGGADFGKSFEHWVLMELLNYRRYREPDLDVRFWRTSTGLEVDFVLGDMETAIEVKATARVADAHLRGLRALREDHATEGTSAGPRAHTRDAAHDTRDHPSPNTSESTRFMTKVCIGVTPRSCSAMS